MAGIQIGGRGGISSIVGLVVVLGICWALGINPLTLLDNGSTTDGSGSGYSQSVPSQTADPAAAGGFRRAWWSRDTETFWGDWFQQQGKTYTPPKVVLFSRPDAIGVRGGADGERAVLLPRTTARSISTSPSTTSCGSNSMRPAILPRPM